MKSITAAPSHQHINPTIWHPKPNPQIKPHPLQLHSYLPSSMISFTTTPIPIPHSASESLFLLYFFVRDLGKIGIKKKKKSKGKIGTIYKIFNGNMESNSTFWNCTSDGPIANCAFWWSMFWESVEILPNAQNWKIIPFWNRKVLFFTKALNQTGT